MTEGNRLAGRLDALIATSFAVTGLILARRRLWHPAAPATHSAMVAVLAARRDAIAERLARRALPASVRRWLGLR
ncbi:MAG: hypothetical protein ACREQ5_08595 [Candidatus Dormibacteria bacterium]